MYGEKTRQGENNEQKDSGVVILHVNSGFKVYGKWGRKSVKEE